MILILSTVSLMVGVVLGSILTIFHQRKIMPNITKFLAPKGKVLDDEFFDKVEERDFKERMKGKTMTLDEIMDEVDG